jgi:hypothetical protein
MVVSILTTCFLSVKAQLLYRNVTGSHLFLGQLPANYTTAGANPNFFIGPNFGIEYNSGGYGGLDLFIPFGSSYGYYQNVIHLGSNAKVGIGMRSNAYALAVNGQVWTTAGLLITSDENLKRNIVNLNDDRNGGFMNRLLKLNGKFYEKQISSSEGNADEVAKMVAQGKLNDENAPDVLASLNKSNPTVYKKEFGFIAQEVKELFPELVEEGDDGVLAINYTGLIPLLVESIKELNKKITDLESRVGESVTIRSTGNEQISVPGAILYQNIPNPSAVGTSIAYELPENYSSAYLYIYNMSGNQIKSYLLNGSSGEVKVSANELPAGTYIYTLAVNGIRIDTKRMILTN